MVMMLCLWIPVPYWLRIGRGRWQWNWIRRTELT
jgi:hypothetical protein